MSKTVPTSFFVYHNGVRCHGKSMNEPGGVKSKGENTMKDMFRKLQLFAEEGAEGGAGDAEASTAEDQEEHRAIRMDPEKLNRDRNRKRNIQTKMLTGS